MEDVRYPIGKVEYLPFTEANKKLWINEIKIAPANLELAVQHLE